MTVRQAGLGEISRLTAWSRGELIFHEAPLREIVAEFNRYNRTQLSLEDPTLEELRFEGAFSAFEPDSLIRALRVLNPPIMTHKEGDVIHIRNRRKGPVKGGR